MEQPNIYANSIHAKEALRIFFKQGAYDQHSQRQMESLLLEQGCLQLGEKGVNSLIPLDKLSTVHSSIMEKYTHSPLLLKISEEEWREKLGNPARVISLDPAFESTSSSDLVTYWGIVDKIRNMGYLRDTARRLIDENLEMLGRGRWEDGLRIFHAHKVDRFISALPGKHPGIQ